MGQTKLRIRSIVRHHRRICCSTKISFHFRRRRRNPFSTWHRAFRLFLYAVPVPPFPPSLSSCSSLPVPSGAAVSLCRITFALRRGRLQPLPDSLRFCSCLSYGVASLHIPCPHTHSHTHTYTLVKSAHNNPFYPPTPSPHPTPSLSNYTANLLQTSNKNHSS